MPTLRALRHAGSRISPFPIGTMGTALAIYVRRGANRAPPWAPWLRRATRVVFASRRDDGTRNADGLTDVLLGQATTQVPLGPLARTVLFYDDDHVD